MKILCVKVENEKIELIVFFFLNVYKRCFIYIDECDVRMAKKGQSGKRDLFQMFILQCAKKNNVKTF